jgi:hypothetical protein
MKVYVTYKQRCVYSKHSNEQYGDWNEIYDSEVTGVSLVKPDFENYTQYEEIELGDVEVKEGDTIFVLSMDYDTGDSFGREEGRMEILWAFTDHYEAKEAARCVEQNKKEYSIKFETERGVITMSNPGYGYFEVIRGINVDEFTVDSTPYVGRLH